MHITIGQSLDYSLVCGANRFKGRKGVSFRHHGCRRPKRRWRRAVYSLYYHGTSSGKSGSTLFLVIVFHKENDTAASELVNTYIAQFCVEFLLKMVNHDV
jgi:hypothetical protein